MPLCQSQGGFEIRKCDVGRKGTDSVAMRWRGREEHPPSYITRYEQLCHEICLNKLIFRKHQYPAFSHIHRAQDRCPAIH